LSSKKEKVLSDNKGIALVAAMGLTLILLVASIALVYRLTNYTRNLWTQAQKTQTYYTSSAGIEEVRDFLWNNSCIPPLWCGWLGKDLDQSNPNYPDIDQYSNITLEVTGVMSPVINNTTYELFLKDNNDDDDYTSDSDEVVLSLATSTAQNETRTTIEAIVIYTGSDSEYKQFSQTSERRGYTLEKDIDFNTRQTF